MKINRHIEQIAFSPDFGRRCVLLLDPDKAARPSSPNTIPWLLIEVKLKRSSIAFQHKKHCQVLGDIPFMQIILEENVAEKTGDGMFQMSASRFF